MRIAFVDTSAWCAVENEDDENHDTALLLLEEIIEGRYRLVTTNYVLDETYTLLLGRVGHGLVIQFKHRIDQMLTSEILTVIQVSESIQESAWAVFGVSGELM